MQPVISCMFPQPLVTRTHPSAYDKILSVFLEASLTQHVLLGDNEGSDDNIILDEDENWWIVVSKGNNGT